MIEKTGVIGGLDLPEKQSTQESGREKEKERVFIIGLFQYYIIVIARCFLSVSS